MIVVVYERNDFHLKVYKSRKQRHIWNTDKKDFLYETYANGLHCNYNNINKKIHEVLSDMVDDVSRIFFPKMYVDRETFDIMNKACDYSKIIKR